jgi:N-acetylmuramoyl-L-alanine amidase
MARTLASLFTPFLSFVLIFSFLAGPLQAVAATDGFDKGVTAKALRDKYEDGKIKILIAAGHEPGFGGAVYQGVYEREIVTEIANELAKELKANPNYEVIVTRDNDDWNSSLSRYFKKDKKKIESFVKKQKKEFAKLVKKGDIKKPSEGDQVDHATAPEDAALRLYGINKWANENDIDLVVNLHINDAPDHGPNDPSKYNGYAVYVPDSAFGNSRTSKELGRDIADRLSKLSDASTMPGESKGVIEDQELIAMGAYGTLNVPSVLIEYGYISEPRFTLPEYRRTVTKDAAYQTYLALQDFFDDEVPNPHSVAKLPTTWPKPVVVVPPPVITPVAITTPPIIPVATTTLPLATTSPVTPATPTVPTSPSPSSACAPFTQTILPAKSATDIDTTGVVKRLQTILAKDKTLYPEGLVTGYFGPATLKAVQALQKKNSIVTSGTPETTGYGAVGPKTAAALLALCSSA